MKKKLLIRTNKSNESEIAEPKLNGSTVQVMLNHQSERGNS